MSRQTRREALPVQYVEKTFMLCDGCGQEEVEIRTAGQFNTGWRHVVTEMENGKGGIDVKSVDYGPKCWSSISRAIDQEVKTLQAEKVAGKAEKHGVS